MHIIYQRGCTFINHGTTFEKDWGNMTWSEIGKQNIQAISKKFYCMLHFVMFYLL